ncbi:tyrosine-type recombinase/integrase [Yoonia algicola]|uniref:Tyrosine-type recombinase/integrase n=1 Tax=Yoonia algicola TaxID=3137368 RepID=A0AAN0M441_9RHOB
MVVKSNRSEHLLTLKGNRWWFRQGIPKPVHRVTGGPSFIMINLETSDIREAKRRRDDIEAFTRTQFRDVRDGLRGAFELPDWFPSAQPSGRPMGLSGAARGAIIRAAMDGAEDDDEKLMIVRAAEAEADRMKPAQRKAFEDAMSGQVKIEHHLQDHLKTAGLAPKTEAERRGIVMMLARWCSAVGLTLDQIDRKRAGQYVAEVLEEKHAKTRAKHISFLRQYWIFMARRGHVRLPQGEAITSGWPWNDQLIETKGKRVERGARKAEERPFTDTEVSTLMNSTFPLKEAWEGVMKDVFLVALLSGMRQAEIVTLWVEEVVEENGHLSFNLQQGKNASAARKVPAHSSLVSMVRERLKGKAGQDPLFHELAGMGNPSDTYGKRFKRWREALDVADVQEDTRRSLVNFHSARRWFTIKARHAEQPKETIADVIGHTPDKQDVTFGVYAREASEGQRRACVEAVRLPLRCLEVEVIIERDNDVQPPLRV